MGGLTEAHLLLVRDRHTLPPDERDGIELIRYGIGELLTDGNVEDAFLFLDAPSLAAARIESYIGERAPAPPPEPDGLTFDTPNFNTIAPEATHEKPGDWALSYSSLAAARLPTPIDRRPPPRSPSWSETECGSPKAKNVPIFCLEPLASLSVMD
jgi:hypothetical protein